RRCVPGIQQFLGHSALQSVRLLRHRSGYGRRPGHGLSRRFSMTGGDMKLDMTLSRRLALTSSFFALAATARFADARPPKGKKEVAEGTPGDTPLGPVDTVAKWAFIQDFTTGAVLLNKLADEPMPPSSMTKLMTIYLVYEQLKKGQIKLTDTVIISARA